MKNKSILYALALLMASLAQVMADLYLPILPAMEKALQTSPHLVQFSIAAYIWGYAFSQLIYVPLSDAYGRKPIIIIGLTIAIIGSWVCFASHHMHWLIVGRCLQGAGAGVGLALSRAILRDLFQGHQLVVVMSYFAIANVAMMTCAPVLGAVLQQWFGWHANFSFLLIYAVAIWLLVLLLLPETNQHRDAGKIAITYIKQAVKSLRQHPSYCYYIFNIFCTYGAVLVWITMSSMLLIKHRHMVPLHYSFIMLGIGAISAVISFINPRMTKRFGTNQMIIVGACFMLAGSALLILGSQHVSIWWVILPIYVFIVGTSFVFGNSIASALTPFANIAGTAAAILGFVQIVGGALTSSLVSLFAMHTALSMGVFIGVLSFLCLGLSIMVVGLSKK